MKTNAVFLQPFVLLGPVNAGPAHMMEDAGRVAGGCRGIHLREEDEGPLREERIRNPPVLDIHCAEMRLVKRDGGLGIGHVKATGPPATDLERVKVGDRAPDFTLESEEGKPISLSDFRGEKAVILVFYRGYW